MPVTASLSASLTFCAPLPAAVKLTRVLIRTPTAPAGTPLPCSTVMSGAPVPSDGASFTEVTSSDAVPVVVALPSLISYSKLTAPLQSAPGVKVQLSMPELESVPLPLASTREPTVRVSPSVSLALASSCAAVMVRALSSAMLPSVTSLVSGARLTASTSSASVSVATLKAVPVLMSCWPPLLPVVRSQALKVKAAELVPL